MIGQRIGPYAVLSKLGEGGMGEVYRARDGKLNRDVALKILPAAVAGDPDRLARFRREAQVLASLNHPNIGGIHGFEDSGDTHALVLELVEGQTLDELIRANSELRPSNVEHLSWALGIARQIVDAIEAAHESGIVHRDLKPANVKVRADGTVKVLDFGLAKALTQDPALSTQDAANSPTLTARATQMGMVLGTAAYMAPEQARGKAVDRRADIWAFGVVLYEMLSGRRAFEGEDVSITLAGVLKEDVKWDALPADLPPALRTLIRRCLEKDPKRRLSWIGEARHVLEDPTAAPASTTDTSAPSTQHSAPSTLVPPWRRTLPWTVAALTTTAALAILFAWNPWRDTPAPAPRTLFANIGAPASLWSTGIGAAAVLSPDGQTLAFVAAESGDAMLYVRRLDQLAAVKLAGTEGAFNPFFSPQGDWIGFFTATHLKKVRVTGGAATVLCESNNGRGATWLSDDTIVFSPTPAPKSVLMRVPAAGGTPQSFGSLSEGAQTQRWPQALPGGTHVLYTEGIGPADWDSANLVVQPLESGAPKVVLRGGHYGRYIAPGPDGGNQGHLIYAQQGVIFAAPFDLARMDVAGPSFPVLDGVLVNRNTGGGQFAASEEGTLVYLPGESASSLASPILWLAGDGKTAPLRSTSSRWSEARFSMDGTRLALVINDGRQNDIWVLDLSRDTMTQLTFEAGNDRTPVWSPDDKRMVFSSDRAKPGGPTNIYVTNADGTGEVARLTESTNAQVAFSWHPKGDAIFFQELRSGTGFDLMVLPIAADAKPQGSITAGTPTVFLSTPGSDVYPKISPDGRWLAYFSTESGTGLPDVYVRPYPGSGGKWRLSSDGTTFPQWSQTTSEILFFAIRQSRIMAVSYSAEGDSFRPDKVRPWSPATYTVSHQNDPYALHPDGKRIAVAPVTTTTELRDSVVFFFNFAEFLKGKK